MLERMSNVKIRNFNSFHQTTIIISNKYFWPQKIMLKIYGSSLIQSDSSSSVESSTMTLGATTMPIRENLKFM
jgi:hypothetical protein